MTTGFSRTLQPTAIINGDHPCVTAFAHNHADEAVRFYFAVRDKIRCDPPIPSTCPWKECRHDSGDF